MRSLCAVWVAMQIAWSPGWLLGDDGAAKPGPTSSSEARLLDAQLLDDLDSELLKGLSDDLGDLAPPSQPPPRAAAPQSGSDSKDAPLEQAPPGDLIAGEDLGAEDTAADDENPLIRIEQTMRQVQRRLSRQDASEETQALQRTIAEEIAILLEQLQQQQQRQRQNQSSAQQQQQQSQASSNSQDEQPQSASSPSKEPAKQPAEDSEERLGKNDEKINPEDLREMFQRAWGHLPPRVREQMQAAAQEQFLPKYQTLIEEYYKRLAEEGPR